MLYEISFGTQTFHEIFSNLRIYLWKSISIDAVGFNKPVYNLHMKRVDFTSQAMSITPKTANNPLGFHPNPLNLFV